MNMDENYLTKNQCNNLIEHALHLKIDKFFRPSYTEYREGVKVIIDTPETLLIKKLCAETFQQTITEIEPVEIVRYEPGAAYPIHYDGFWRNGTTLVYLNEDYVGGNTEFTTINKLVIPKTGSALSWRNAVDGQNVTQNAHKVNKVIDGVKWIAVTWARNPDKKPMKGY